MRPFTEMENTRTLEKVFFGRGQWGWGRGQKFSFGPIKGKMLMRHPNADVE